VTIDLPRAPEATTWPRERIEALLRSERFDYQAIPLPHGLSTGGHDRSDTARQIFPDRLDGQSVLDIGSSLGFFCFEARRRGAERVVGLDFDLDNIRKARLLSEILGLEVEFRPGDLDGEAIGESFDHVLCLNVLHHLSDPILSLDKLVAAARRRLVLEVATLGRHDARQLGLGWLAQRLLARSPALVVGRGTAGEGVRQFYFTPSSVENLLRYRRGCFAKVEILPSGFKERFVVIAHKRRIGELLAIAGPTGCDLADLFRRAAGDAGRSAAWGEPMRADQYADPAEPERDRLAFFYEIDRPVTTGAGNYSHDPALDVLDTAARRSVLTVWRAPQQVVERLDGALSTASGRQRKRLKRLREHYAEPRRLVAQFRSWFSYLDGKGIEHRVLIEDGGATVPAAEWERTIAAPLLAG
jgi:2-polyprenyl-3-methyl-5-hydroxy-6-metoxy-1,4-benzoquinol methylase